VFIGDAGVLDGHFPAAKVHEFGAEFLVRGKKRSAFQHISHHGTTAWKKKEPFLPTV
jgi:hypothetical protein